MTPSQRFWYAALALLRTGLLLPAAAYDNGLGLTPPMGWNSWNKFGCNINEGVVRETAQAMLDLGLDRLGYQYVNLDDCWQKTRNATGFIVADADRFPSGIPALAEEVHGLGLLFGLYSDAGLRTCQRRPGGLGFEVQDAQVYAEWKVDYLKYDNCYNAFMNLRWRYQRMHEALNATGRPIYYGLCEWGAQDPATWAKPVGNSWRTTGDIHANWKSIMGVIDANDRWHDRAGPGGWNDPDMLEVGNGDLTLDEQISHFTLWCLAKAPLLLGNDLREIPPEVLTIITNEEVIAWNQDPLGVQGYKRRAYPTASFSKGETLEVWAGDLSGGRIAVVLLNRSPEPMAITAVWADLGLPASASMSVRDTWAHADLGVFQGNLTVAAVPSHGVVALELSPDTATKREDSPQVWR